MKHKTEHDVSARSVGTTIMILSLVLVNFVEPAAAAATEKTDSHHLLQNHCFSSRGTHTRAYTSMILITSGTRVAAFISCKTLPIRPKNISSAR